MPLTDGTTTTTTTTSILVEPPALDSRQWRWAKFGERYVRMHARACASCRAHFAQRCANSFRRGLRCVSLDVVLGVREESSLREKSVAHGPVARAVSAFHSQIGVCVCVCARARVRVEACAYGAPTSKFFDAHESAPRAQIWFRENTQISPWALLTLLGLPGALVTSLDTRLSTTGLR